MFLASSVLIMLGLIVIVAGSVVINNILARFWKPVSLFTTDSFNGIPSRYATEEELARTAPHFDQKPDKTIK